MTRGLVNGNLEASVPLRLRGPTGIELAVHATIDTGFTGVLTLSAADISRLHLKRRMGGVATLADTSLTHFDVCLAEAEWNGAWRTVLVWALGDDTLVGMRLLAGHALYIEVKTAGSVVIDKLP